MNNARISRNDPCHCGSGKKYKRCHMPSDEQQSMETRKASAAAADDAQGFAAATLRLRVTQASHPAPAEASDRMEAHLAETQLIQEYVRNQARIKAAWEILETHRAEGEAMAKNGAAFAERAQRLFGEEQFSSMRFPAEDLLRAFAAVGHQPHKKLDDKSVETLRKTILFLADKEKRLSLAMRLLVLLPDYVEAGRFLDGWMIQICAFDTIESRGESNPFLFHMFLHGYAEWERLRNAKMTGLFQKLGIDGERIRGMRPDELEQWLESKMTDPDLTKEMTAFLTAHPETEEEARVNFFEMEQAVAGIFDRADAGPLLLSHAETEPWLVAFQQRFVAEHSRFESLKSGRAPDNATKQAFDELIMSVVQEMAAAIFTSDRRAQLKPQLIEYAQRLSEAGEDAAVKRVQAALMLIRSERDPSENYFLIALCHASLRDLMHAMSGTDTE